MSIDENNRNLKLAQAGIYKITTKVIFILLGCGMNIVSFAETTCKEIAFFEGPSITMRSSLVESINAVIEAPELRVFSVSVVPPRGGSYEDVESIIIYPQPSSATKKQGICGTTAEANCMAYLTTSGMLVLVYFKKVNLNSRESTMQQVQRYVNEEVFSCSSASLQVGLWLS